jgi:hypothetical protein
MRVLSWLCAGSLLALSLASLACGGSTPSSPTTPAPTTTATPTGSVTSVAVTGPMSLAPGQTAQFTATATLSDGTRRNCTAASKWSSQSASVATVSAAGLVSAVVPGFSSIEAYCQDQRWGWTQLAVGATTYALSGTVRDDAGTSLVAAYVTLTSSLPPHVSTNPQTDASGQYQVRLLPGSYTVSPNKPYYESLPATMTITADTVRDFTLVPYGPQMSGTVTEIGTSVAVAGASIEIVAGANAGRTATTGEGGTYLVRRLSPGTFTVRASKAGFEPTQQSVTLSATDAAFMLTVNLSLKPSTACLDSVTPSLFKYFPSGGGTGEITVSAPSGRAWTATAAQTWLQVLDGVTGVGSGRIVFRAEPNPTNYGSSFRKGAITVGCQANGGREVAVWQCPDCHALLQASPATPNPFPAAGGTGGVWVLTDSPFSCVWQAVSQADWITITGSSEGQGDGGITFTVAPNPTGAQRTGVILIAEKPWQVVQKG